MKLKKKSLWNDINNNIDYNKSELGIYVRTNKYFSNSKLKENNNYKKNNSQGNLNLDLTNNNQYFPKRNNKIENNSNITKPLNEKKFNNQYEFKNFLQKIGILQNKLNNFSKNFSNGEIQNKYKNNITNNYLYHPKLDSVEETENKKYEINNLNQIHNKMKMKNPKSSLIKKITGYQTRKENKKINYDSYGLKSKSTNNSNIVNLYNNNYGDLILDNKQKIITNKTINNIIYRKPINTSNNINDFIKNNRYSSKQLINNKKNENYSHYNEKSILKKEKNAINSHYYYSSSKSQNNFNIRQNNYLNKQNLFHNGKINNFKNRNNYNFNANNNKNIYISDNGNNDDSSDSLSDIAEELVEKINQTKVFNGPKYYNRPIKVAKIIGELNKDNNNLDYSNINKNKNHNRENKINHTDIKKWKSEEYGIQNSLKKEKTIFYLKNYSNYKSDDKNNILLNLNNDINYHSQEKFKRIKKSINEDSREKFKDIIRNGRNMFNSDARTYENTFTKTNINKIFNNNNIINNNIDNYSDKYINTDRYNNNNKKEIVNNVDNINIMNSLIIINKNDEKEKNEMDSYKNNFLKISDLKNKIRNDKILKEFNSEPTLINYQKYKNKINKNIINKLKDGKNSNKQNSLINKTINKKETHKSKTDRHITFNTDNNLIYIYNQKSSLFDYYEKYNNNKEKLPLNENILNLNEYMKLLKNIKDINPCIKKYNKDEIKINKVYEDPENLSEKDIIPDLDTEGDEDIKSLEKSLENSIDKSLGKNYDKIFRRKYIENNNNVGLYDLKKNIKNGSSNINGSKGANNQKQLYKMFIQEVDEEYEK